MAKIEPKFSCDLCDKEFKSEEALAMHKKAKHSTEREKSKRENEKKGKKSFSTKTIRNWAIFLILIGLISWFVFWAFSSVNSNNNLPVTEINIRSHQNIAFHYHSELEIVINSEKTLIPANVGVYPGIMRPVHTHDDSGEIHIEGPQPREFTLGDFFLVWGRTLNSNCVFDNCADSGQLKMYVNGVESFEFENYVLRDHDNILIEYNSFE